MAEAQGSKARKIILQVDTLTVGELEQLENIAGLEATLHALSGQIGGKALLAIALIDAQRRGEDVTLDEIRGWNWIDVLVEPQAEAPNPQGSAG